MIKDTLNLDVQTGIGCNFFSSKYGSDFFRIQIRIHNPDYETIKSEPCQIPPLIKFLSIYIPNTQDYSTIRILRLSSHPMH